MKGSRDLFLEELGDILYAERTIEKMLKTIRQSASDEKLVTRLQEHERETRGQIENVNKVFAQLGSAPKAKPCPGIQGIKEELEEVKEDGFSGALGDVALLGPAARIEHYEIAAYEGLVTMAKAMGQSRAATLLEKNLKQEQAMLRDGKTAARRLAGKAAKAESNGSQADGSGRPSSSSRGRSSSTRSRSATSSKSRAKKR
ncbi:MAG: ferritin-like domain-containing protein [Gaiellaceae bacterium]